MTVQPTTCPGLIDLSTPTRSERRRGFQPPFYTVFVYRCPQCHGETVLRASAFRGRRAVPGTGAVSCGRPLVYCGCTRARCSVHPNNPHCPVVTFEDARERVFRRPADHVGIVMCRPCAFAAISASLKETAHA